MHRLGDLGADGYAIMLTSGQTDADNDFGNYQNATKTGMKFQDTNANGVKDAGEPGLATWVINAYADTAPRGPSAAEFTAGPARTTRPMPAATTASAAWTPGKYVVCEVLKASWIQSFPGGADELHRVGDPRR